MGRKVLIISTSLRSGSNSELLADAFYNGAVDNGASAEKITLRDKHLEFCRGCLACTKTNRCIINDDASQIIEKMEKADILVFATPIYYYEMSGQMKTLLDRANPLYTSDYTFREAYFLATAAEDDKDTMNRALQGFEGWLACFPKCQLSASLFAGGVTAPHDIDGNKALKEAYELGRSI